MAGAARARGALVGSGGGGVGGGDVQSQRRWRQWRRLLHPPPRVTVARRRLDSAVLRKFSTVGFVFRARSRHRRPWAWRTGQNHLGEGFWGEIVAK